MKTFLQHAWGIATHDFIYKSDDVDWSGARIAYQVKAMLENAELSISEAKQLATSRMLDREDRKHVSLGTTIIALRKRWPADRLPTDLKRLAQTIEESAYIFRISMDDLWAAVDRATAAGAGAETLDLSPYGAVISALVSERGAALFEPLQKGRKTLFVPHEVGIPPLPREVSQKLVRTSLPSETAAASPSQAVALSSDTAPAGAQTLSPPAPSTSNVDQS